MRRAGKVRVLVVVTALLAGTLGGCSLLLGLDPLRGHPCDDAGSCLPGWVCNAKSECVPESPDGGDAGSCPAGQVAGADGGSCVYDCSSLACPAGDACDPATGCAPVTSGLGAPCTTDSDCAGALPACQNGGATCLCLFSSTGAGICVGVPQDPTDCTVCGSGACVKPSLPAVGTAGGNPAPRSLCVPPGFELCQHDADCVNPKGGVVCGLDAFSVAGTGNTAPIGVFPACTTPTASPTSKLGQPCVNPGDCPTGLCLPAGQGETRCAVPCAGDGDCTTGMPSCITGWVYVMDGAGQPSEGSTKVCGVGGTLGSTCDPSAQPATWPCATDAPQCVTNPKGTSTGLCTRGCASNADCSAPTTCVKPQGATTQACYPP